MYSILLWGLEDFSSHLHTLGKYELSDDNIDDNLRYISKIVLCVWAESLT